MDPSIFKVEVYPDAATMQMVINEKHGARVDVP
jgi:hypothetical protein